MKLSMMLLQSLLGLSILVACKPQIEMDISALPTSRFEKDTNPIGLIEAQSVGFVEQTVEAIGLHSEEPRYCTATVTTHGRILTSADCFHRDEQGLHVEGAKLYLKNPKGDVFEDEISSIHAEGKGWVIVNTDNQEEIEEDYFRAPVRLSPPEVKDLQNDLRVEIYTYDVDSKNKKAVLKREEGILRTEEEVKQVQQSSGDVVDHFKEERELSLDARDISSASPGGPLFYNKEIVSTWKRKDNQTKGQWLAGPISSRTIHNH